MIKVARLIAVFMLLLCCAASFAQQNRFGLLKGNSQEILCAYADRDSSLLFTLDKTGDVVVWNTDDFTPVRRFRTVPASIWQEDMPFSRLISMGVSKNKVWVLNHPVRQGGNGVYDIYGRVSGRRYAQSDTGGRADLVHVLKNDGVIMTRSFSRPVYRDGKMYYAVLAAFAPGSNENRELYLGDAVSAIQVSPDERYVALGYRTGGAEVYSLANFEKVLSSKPPVSDQVRQVRFLNDNKSIVYSHTLTDAGVFLHTAGRDQPEAVTLPGQQMLMAEVSPTGRYLAVYNPFTLGIYDLESKQFVARSLTDSLAMRTNAITFLTDHILVLAGSALAGQEDIYSSGAMDKAALLRLNWKTRKASRNRSYDDLNRAMLDAQMQAAGDSAYKITNLNAGYIHLIEPARLRNTFVSNREYTGPGVAVDNEMPSTSIWFLHDDLSGTMRLIEGRGEDASDTVTRAKVKAIAGYLPLKIHPGAELVLWVPNDHDLKKPYLVCDFRGKELHRYLADRAYNHSVWISADGNWLAYQRSAAEILLFNTRNFSRPRVVPTGLPASQFIAGRPVFNAASTRMAYRSFLQGNLNAFRLVSMELASGRADTLVKFDASPHSYALSPDFGKLAMSFPLNWADTALTKNPAKIQEALRYGFRNRYKPAILLLDLLADQLQVFENKGNTLAGQMLVMPGQVAALHEDGLIYYYDTADTASVITHWLNGKEQVIMAQNAYYASAASINRVTQYADGAYYLVGNQDRFYNQPHQVMRQLRSNKKELIALYEKAFEKRMAQYSDKQPVSNTGGPLLLPDAKQRHEFYTPDSELVLNLPAGPGNTLQRLVVTVNEYSVFGKDGLSVEAGRPSIQLRVPLDPGNNDIRIQGVDSKGRYSKPLYLDYYADYKPDPVKAKRALWILSVGVSVYADSLFNLKYAAKDARDFVRVFGYKDNFDTVMVRTVTDRAATAQHILDEIRTAGRLNRGDAVVVYMAGHGLLDDRANFYFATHDMDFANPAKSGLAYEDLMKALEALPVRSKVLFLDACHSGLLDRSRYDYKPASYQPGTRIVPQSTRGTVGTNTGTAPGYPDEDVFLFMQKVFSNLSVDNSVNVLSASLGNSYALENDSLQNGLFTYALIKALGLAKADPRVKTRKYGEGSLINLKNLESYLNREVKRLSNGRQIPTFSLSRTADMIYFSESAISSLYIHDMDYKPLDPKDYKPGPETLYRNFLDRYKR